jgi:O-acetyl-ADP-ribose deacetylase
MSNADACQWMLRLKIKLGDITREKVDAIVNAANESLLGGGGVDGAIHRMAGPDLLTECRTIGGCPTGEARITGAYRLPARHVIHTVGPVWRGGQHGEAELLARCYRSSFDLAKEHGIKSLAFPAISCGVYGYPLDQAARIALDEIHRFLTSNEAVERVTVVCFGREVYDAYGEALQNLIPE